MKKFNIPRPAPCIVLQRKQNRGLYIRVTIFLTTACDFNVTRLYGVQLPS